MKNTEIYCYCDFSVANDVIGERVRIQLVDLCDQLGINQRFISYSSENDKGWTGNIYHTINQLKDDQYVFIWFDDLLVRPNDLVDAVSQALMFLGEYPYIRVTGRPPPIGKEIGDGFRLISGKECYQSSLVGSLWSVAYFKQMINKDDSPWIIEHQKHSAVVIGSVKRLSLLNTKIKGKDNIFQHPHPDFSLANIRASVPWVLNNTLREILVKFPRLYHWVISK